MDYQKLGNIYRLDENKFQKKKIYFQRVQSKIKKKMPKLTMLQME